MAETSDTKFLNTCLRHLDRFKAEPRWNPSNKRLEITALQTQLDGGYPIAKDVFSKVAPYKIKINDQQAAFARIDPMVRASRRYFKSTGAPEAEIADANTIINKLLDTGKKKILPLDPNLPAATIEQKNSTSHRSNDSRLGNLIALREFYASTSAFAPNESDIKLTAFDTLIAECQTAIAEVSQSFNEALGAWNERDAKLYDNADSILADFRDAKEYYKSLYNPKDPEYKAIQTRDMKLFSNSRT